MRIGVRTKFVGTLALVALLPLCIALASLHVLGHRYFLAEKGRLYRAIAEHLAESLNGGIATRVDTLQAWMTHVPLAAAAREAADSPLLPPAAAGARPGPTLAAVDDAWRSGAPPADLLRFVLTNRAARTVQAFQHAAPLFGEILVADRFGRLVAASNPSTDFWQADEAWWQESMRAPIGTAWLEGVAFDDSAGVYSIDIALGLPSGEAVPSGVLKASLDISPFLQSLRSERFALSPERLVVDARGNIVASLTDGAVVPFVGRIAGDELTRLQDDVRGWCPFETKDGRRIGALAAVHHDADAAPGLEPLYVLVSHDEDALLAPVRNQLAMVSLAGIAVVALFALLGLVIADREILAPLRAISSAAQAISVRARLRARHAGGDLAPSALTVGQRDVRRMIERVQAIRARDEFGELARDFQLMADRILRYHEHLEEELQRRTEELQGDLLVAREFQEALLPRNYPSVTGNTPTHALALRFHHVYRPATSVGGDFFDVIKIDEHRAGLFLADVMGHGTRSALITAILRALLQSLHPCCSDPGALLSALNRSFRSVLPEGIDVIFVTALYMVFDTEAGAVSYATAGHHAPWCVSRGARTAAPMTLPPRPQPALGLMDEVDYGHASAPLDADCTFVLFTDGILEATNSQGSEFGESRLRALLSEHAHEGAALLTQSLMDALRMHMGTVVAHDDLCVVAVEARGHDA